MEVAFSSRKKGDRAVEGNEFHIYLPSDSCVSCKSVNSSSSCLASILPPWSPFPSLQNSFCSQVQWRKSQSFVFVEEGGRRPSRCFREADFSHTHKTAGGPACVTTARRTHCIFVPGFIDNECLVSVLAVALVTCAQRERCMEALNCRQFSVS